MCLVRSSGLLLLVESKEQPSVTESGGAIDCRSPNHVPIVAVTMHKTLVHHATGGNSLPDRLLNKKRNTARDRSRGRQLRACEACNMKKTKRARCKDRPESRRERITADHHVLKEQSESRLQHTSTQWWCKPRKEMSGHKKRESSQFSEKPFPFTH